VNSERVRKFPAVSCEALVNSEILLIWRTLSEFGLVINLFPRALPWAEICERLRRW